MLPRHHILPPERIRRQLRQLGQLSLVKCATLLYALPYRAAPRACLHQRGTSVCEVSLVAKRLPLLKNAAEHAYKTRKYIDIRIDGDSARVVSECEIPDIVDSDGAIKRQVSVTILRKIDGKWRIAKNAILRY